MQTLRVVNETLKNCIISWPTIDMADEYIIEGMTNVFYYEPIDVVNENFYTIETKECLGDFWEINFPVALDDFERNLVQLEKITDKYNCDFLGYDDIANLMDIGWENSFPKSEILNNFIEEIEEQLTR